jgi:sugar phosphate isomerase/epimerase
MLQLGIITYNIAKDWDLPTILSRLEKLGIAGVELRTTHAHKVESNLTREQRQEVRKRFDDSPVDLAGLGTAFEFQATDSAVVRKNIDGTREYVRLAHDIGAPGVKVRPNGIPKGADREETFKRIGQALHEVGEDATGFGVEIRVEVHGGVTSEVPNFAKIMKYANHPNVYACWNSNPTDVVDGSVRANFELLGPKIHEVHIHDLFDEKYPYRELFALLAAQGYDGYTLAEMPESTDPDRVLRYYRALWLAYQPSRG